MFDDLDPLDLSNRLSIKWSRDDPGVVAAWVADMDFEIAPPIKAALQDVLDRDDVGYPGQDLRDSVRRAFADRMLDRFAWTVDPDDSWLLTTVVQGIHVALDLASEPGDGVLVQTPIYPPFLAAIDTMQRRLVEGPLGRDGDRYIVDPDLLESAVDASTRVLLLCNPHNPTGRVFTVDELRAIGEVAVRHDLTVVADEIHQDLVYPGHTHHVFSVVNPELAERTITLTSASKAFNLAGNRCSVIHLGSPELRQRFEARTHRFYGEVSLMGLVSTLSAWTDDASSEWLSELLGYLDGNRSWLADAIAERFPLARHVAPEGTYLAWVDLRGYDLGDDPSEVLLAEGRVALGSGPEFGTRGAGHVRINMATSRSILEEVVDRVESVLSRDSSTAGARTRTSS